MNLADPATLRALLARHGLGAKKGLGQHFLCSGSTVESIVSRLSGISGVLEIGPGPGVLTSALCGDSRRVLALELDERMITVLAESAPAASVSVGDALREDLGALLERLPRPRAVVSNLPYYITAALLGRIEQAAEHLDKAVLMMQREVAERVSAAAGQRERGALSVYLQARFAIETVCDVPASCFWPEPKVESRVLEFVPCGTGLSKEEQRLVRIGFSQPRKMLANNLAAGLRVSRSSALEMMAAAGIEEKARASDASLEQWRALAERADGG